MTVNVRRGCRRRAEIRVPVAIHGWLGERSGTCERHTCILHFPFKDQPPIAHDIPGQVL